jgi:hypothetical protein
VAGTLGLPSVHYLDLTGIWVPGDLGSNSALSSFPALTSRSFYLTCTMGTPMTKWDSSRWGTFQMSFVWKGPRLLLLNHTPWLLPLRMGTFNNFFFLMGLGFELRALYLQSRSSTPWAIPPVHFALVILEMESHKLFAWLVLNHNPPDLSLPSS